MTTLVPVAVDLAIALALLLAFGLWRRHRSNKPKRINKIRRAYRRRRFQKAYKILRKEAARHTAAGHMMDFRAVNESHLIMQCTACPQLTPFPRKQKGRRRA